MRNRILSCLEFYNFAKQIFEDTVLWLTIQKVEMLAFAQVYAKDENIKIIRMSILYRYNTCALSFLTLFDVVLVLVFVVHMLLLIWFGYEEENWNEKRLMLEKMTKQPKLILLHFNYTCVVCWNLLKINILSFGEWSQFRIWLHKKTHL